MWHIDDMILRDAVDLGSCCANDMAFAFVCTRVARSWIGDDRTTVRWWYREAMTSLRHALAP